MRKRLLIGGIVCSVLLLSALLNEASSQGQGNSEGNSEIQRGFQIAPVPLNMAGKNPSLVGLGSYLVNGPSDCTGCHTVIPPYLPGGDPFQGQPERINPAVYLAGGRPFGPVIVSRNLTPDRNGRPGGLTFEQFEQAIRFGTDFKGLPPHVPSFPGLLQVMPWPVHRHSTDQRIRAMYEYLSAIPCIEGGPGQPANRC